MTGFRTLRAQIRRRILVSYRVDPAVAQDLLPDGFRPQLVDGSAVAGVCLIGMQSVRPGWVRPRVGFSTENAAHRIAVEWDEDGETHTGVYIIERHSSGLLPVLAGGRLFPGVQKRARFDVDDTDSRFRVAMTSSGAAVSVNVELSRQWSSTLFPSVDAASAFYKSGAVGWSPRRGGHGVEPIELTSSAWAVEPGRVVDLRSSFFDSLPEGAATLDSVLVMRDIPVVWAIPHIEPDSSSRRQLADSAAA
ncbi:MAG: hypothetical protein QOH69_2889 [Actinomycetota bacterium]|jgi:hypothetical protein|nr:hypothetical protein [Actinomycetota bacterium]